MRSELLRQRLRKRDQAAFSNRVGARSRSAARSPGDRDHIDDCSGLARNHRRRDGLRAKHRARQVETHDFVPTFFSQFKNLLPLDQGAGVVHQNVNRTKSLRGLLHQQTNFFSALHVRPYGDGSSARFNNIATYLLGPCFVMVVTDRHLCAQAAQQGGRRRTYPRGRARDQSDFIRQIQIVVHRVSPIEPADQMRTTASSAIAEMVRALRSWPEP